MNKAKVAMNFKNNQTNWNRSIIVLRTMDENAKIDLENAFPNKIL